VKDLQDIIYYILWQDYILLIYHPPTNRREVVSPEFSVNATPFRTTAHFGYLGPDRWIRQGMRKITRSVLPDVDHLCLMRHDRRISPDRIYSRDDELGDVRLVRDRKSVGGNPPFHRIRA